MSTRCRMLRPPRWRFRKADGIRCSIRQSDGNRRRYSNSSGHRASRGTSSRPEGRGHGSRSSGRGEGHRSGEADGGQSRCSRAHADAADGNRREAAAVSCGRPDAEDCSRCHGCRPPNRRCSGRSPKAQGGTTSACRCGRWWPALSPGICRTAVLRRRTIVRCRPEAWSRACPWKSCGQMPGSDGLLSRTDGLSSDELSQQGSCGTESPPVRTESWFCGSWSGAEVSWLSCGWKSSSDGSWSDAEESWLSCGRMLSSDGPWWRYGAENRRYAPEPQALCLLTSSCEKTTRRFLKMKTRRFSTMKTCFLRTMRTNSLTMRMTSLMKRIRS